MPSPRYLTWVTRYQAATVILLTGACFVFWPDRALALLSGGVLMTANFWALRFFAARALLGERPKLASGLVLVLKFVAVSALMAVCLLVLKLDVLGFALGLASLFVGIALATLHQAFTPAVDKRQ